MATVNPYLTFNGKCEEAFNFYKSVLGGEFVGGINRFSSMPPEHFSPGEENLVMHVMLPIGQGTALMGSDSSSRMGQVKAGDNFSIALSPDSEEDATRIFNGLSAGGTITMPLGQAPWGALFGMFTDKYGFPWMVNYQQQ